MLSLKSERIPRATIRRLAVYVQVLESMQRNGVEVISSGPLAEACDVNASQVRKDLAYFGEFGVRGVGYNVASLIAAIKASLGVDREWRAALIGVGNLGRALLHHAEFKARGFNIVGAFDCDPFKIGEQVYGLEVTCTSDLKSAVDALTAGGNTNHADAFTKANALFDPASTNTKVIVMFTDGNTTAGDPPPLCRRRPRPRG